MSKVEMKGSSSRALVGQGKLGPCRFAPPPRVGYYVYASKADSLKARPKYRSGLEKPRGAHDYYNTMWDPHVYRGETFVPFQKVEAARRKAIEAAKDRKKRLKKLPPRKLGGIVLPSTPPHASGQNLLIDLSRFLEEPVRHLDEVDESTNTDLFEDPRPPCVPVPPKIGYDVSTGIEPGDLFQFDTEVEPILETLVLKVLEQSLLENCEEEELRLLRDEQNHYEEGRRLEGVRLARLAARERFLACERERRLRVEERRAETGKEVEARIGARMFAKSYLKLLTPHLFVTLEEMGFLQTANATAVTESFIPWINVEVKEEISENLLARAMVDDVLESVIGYRAVEMEAAAAWNRMPDPPAASDAEEEDAESWEDEAETTGPETN